MTRQLVEIEESYVAPGRGPAGLAWNGRFLFHADYREGKIFQLDAQNGQVVGSFICPGVLSGLAWDGRSLWQAILDEGWLRRINPETHDFDQTVVVPEAGWLSGVAWDGQRLWAVSQQQGKLFAIDAESGQVLRTLPCPVAGGGLAFHDGMLWLGAPDRMRFDAQAQQFEWVGEADKFVLVQIDTTDGREIGRFPLTFLPMGVAWINGALWLSQSQAHKLHRARLIG